MNTRSLFASDIDGTLIPHKEDTQAEARIKFSTLLSKNEDHLDFCMVSGRSLNLILKAIKDYSLPSPKYIISDVGSAIYLKKGDHYFPLNNYKNALKDSLGLDSIQSLSNDIQAKQYLIQEAEKQSEFKLSYYREISEPSLVKEELEQIFSSYLEKIKIVTSLDHNKNCLLVDILPSASGKLSALKFLATDRSIDLANVIYAGDSGNDLEVFLGGIKSIVVANTDFETKERIKLHTDSKLNCFFSHADVIEGVLEGLEHFL